MKMLINAARVRALLENVRTEKDVEMILRAHRIRYSYDTSAGYTAFRIPARYGPVLVFRTASRKAPFMVQAAPARCTVHAWPRYITDNEF